MKRKECPSCAMMVDSNEEICPVCQYEFTGFSPGIKWLAVVLIIVFIGYIFFAILR